MIIKTFETLQDDVLRWYDELVTSGPMRGNVAQALNAAHASRLGERGWSFMKWPGKKSFTTVAGQQEYVLHLEFFRPIYFFDTTLQQFLKQKTDPLLTSLTKETEFELRGISCVAQQPAAASKLRVTSTSGSDGSSQQAIVRGEIANGAIHEETITCAGADSVEDFVRVLRVTKLGTWTGSMKLETTGGAAELLRLGPTEQGRQYQVLFFPVAPTSTRIVEYEFYRQPTNMVADNDIPDIPSPYQDVIVYDALIQLAAYNPVEGEATTIWSERRTKLEMGLIETYGEALALERVPILTQYTDRV